ncbi:MAG: substrate-binding domain-containing protein, partial [Lachnospiraceae bacterium]|nr:substrate-binding domain-containing protein [Lachnospiraceae bacterium]
MKRKWMAALLALTLSVTLFGCSSGGSDDTAGDDTKKEADSGSDSKTDGGGTEGLKVGFSQCDNGNSWRIAETESMQETAKEYGVELVYTDASADIAKQASDIEDMVAQGVDYLVVAPQEEDGLQAALKSAMD